MPQRVKKPYANWLKSRVLQHGAFWLFAFAILVEFFAREYGAAWLPINLIYTALFLWPILLVCYLNLLIFIPRFLRPRKWLWFILALVATVPVAIGLHFFTFGYLSDWLFPGYYFISFYEPRDILNFVVIFLAATTLLKLAKSWFDYIEQEQKFQRLEKEKVAAELQALKAQINPHFLFNSLNSLYALSLDQDERVSALLLKLSANMRYMLYETNEHFVPLKKEVEYLENYLDLQRLRSDQRVKINFKLEGDVDQQRIMPLAFIPFVENAFKHGIKGDTEDVFVDMTLKIEKAYLLFHIGNNKGKANDIEQGVGGVGLENVRKRLDLLYGKNYELHIHDGETTYEVQLKIPIR